MDLIPVKALCSGTLALSECGGEIDYMLVVVMVVSHGSRVKHPGQWDDGAYRGQQDIG